MSETKEKNKGGAKKWLTRIGVGIICAVFAVGLLVLIGYGQIKYLSFVMSIVCGLILHEVMGVTGCKSKRITMMFLLLAGFIPIYLGFDFIKLHDFKGDPMYYSLHTYMEMKIPGFSIMLFIMYILAVLMIMLRIYEKVRFENVTIGLFWSLAAPASVYTLRLTYDFMEQSEQFTRAQVVFVLLISMFSAWLCDTFALFVGSAIGKHKLAPKISPKKSIEGAVGGVLCTTIGSVIAYFVARIYFGGQDNIKLWMVIVFVPIVCVFGICGDLAASVIKRNFGVKDFGTLLPEHGGALDRVDSFLFTMPATYVIVRLLTEIMSK